MKEIFEIHKYAFTYKMTAVLVIVSNLLFTIFNIISLILFIPFLQIIFLDPEEKVEKVIEPIYSGGFIDFFKYISDYYNYFMQSMVADDPKKALLFVCLSVISAFFLKIFSVTVLSIINLK